MICNEALAPRAGAVLGASAYKAIRRKLMLEIAGLPPQVTPAAGHGKRVDCMVGERLRQQWLSE